MQIATKYDTFLLAEMALDDVYSLEMQMIQKKPYVWVLLSLLARESVVRTSACGYTTYAPRYPIFKSYKYYICRVMAVVVYSNCSISHSMQLSSTLIRALYSHKMKWSKWCYICHATPSQFARALMQQITRVEWIGTNI